MEVNALLQHKAYEYRIYPNKEQEILIARTIGCSRFVYNHFLEMWNNEYEETCKGLTYVSCSKLLTELNHGTALYQSWNLKQHGMVVKSSR